MKKLISAIITLGLFISCNSSNHERSATGTSEHLKDEKVINVVDKTLRSFKGLYKYSKEANTFQDCNDPSKMYWVNDSSATISQAYKKATSSLSYPEETVYAEVKGYLAGKAASGYASDYENVLIVTSVDKLEQKSYKTPCYDFEFIAIGNEPFWSIDIIPAEQKIVLKNVAKEKVYIFPYQPANVGGGVHRFETKNAKNEKLVIILREEKCSDGMSDSNYNYSAEVVINRETLKGCAIKKGDLRE
ncbi:MAG: hypothetical protein JWN56_728 [Sphingobacteriales bacterium]|nr:hypothetical protein [Sphingobacteriales bacterium]